MSRTKKLKPSQEDIIENSLPNHLYSHEFGRGRFFQIVHEDENGFGIKIGSRTMLKAVYITEKEDIEGIEFIKLVNGSEVQKLALNGFNLGQAKAFLNFLTQFDLKGINERRIRLADGDELSDESVKQIKTFLLKKGGPEIIETLIEEGIITSRDIVNTAFRKRGLEIFKKLLENKEYWKTYAAENGKPKAKEETAWQLFFERNEWIFGYGLDYRYQNILQREANVSDADLDGKNTVVGDFLMGDERFTTFVELKKPTTNLFGNSQNRSNCWSLSSELQDSLSQILEQKASGIIKLDTPQYNDRGELITQKPYDSKVILVIGHWNELDDSSSERERSIKMKTLELYRRDSRNVEILTYDELYNRAEYIVYSKMNKKNKLNVVEVKTEEDDDLPF